MAAARWRSIVALMKELLVHSRIIYSLSTIPEQTTEQLDPPPLCHPLLRFSSRKETWALFSSQFWVCLHYLCRTSSHFIFTSNQLSVFTNALLQLGNYSAHIHQAHIFMSFMRNYWDKTRSYCKCAWLWSLHQNSLCDRALRHSEKKSCFMARTECRSKLFFHIQNVHTKIFWFVSLEVHSKVTTKHRFINYGN